MTPPVAHNSLGTEDEFGATSCHSPSIGLCVEAVDCLGRVK